MTLPMIKVTNSRPIMVINTVKTVLPALIILGGRDSFRRLLWVVLSEVITPGYAISYDLRKICHADRKHLLRYRIIT